MKLIAKITTLLLLTITASSAADLRVTSGRYSFSGTHRLYSTAETSNMFRSGLGRAYYQPGSVTATVANRSSYRSGTVVLNLWISSYIGAPTGTVVYSKGWGGNTNFVFNALQSWTCTKAGNRKIINSFGYASLGAHEYTGSWPMRNELSFTGSYGKW